VPRRMTEQERYQLGYQHGAAAMRPDPDRSEDWSYQEGWQAGEQERLQRLDASKTIGPKYRYEVGPGWAAMPPPHPLDRDKH